MTDPVLILQKAVDLRDPHDCTDSGDALALLDAIFDAPVRRRPDGGYAPALAERWEVSVDARTWTLHLRDGLSFHDGRPLDAAAMARSIARMQRPDVGATLGAPAVWGQYLGGATIAAPASIFLLESVICQNSLVSVSSVCAPVRRGSGCQLS